MELFDRVYRVVFGNKKAAREFNNLTDGAPALQVKFTVSKEHTPEPNVAKISLYNLSESSRAQCEESDVAVEIYAGYRPAGSPSLMAAGYVVDAYSKRDSESGDIVTELDVYDGWLPLRDTIISMSYKKGASAHQLLQAIASAMKCGISIAKGAPDYTWLSGFSYQGSAHGGLTKACSAAGLKWSIQNGVIQVTQLLNSTQKKAAVINEGSGMIGSPERVYKAAEELQKKPLEKGEKRPQNVTTVLSTSPDRQKRRGWRVKTLLRPDISPGDLVVVESKGVTGTFMADKVQHSGDLYGDDWTTTLELYEDTTGKYTYTKEK